MNAHIAIQILPNTTDEAETVRIVDAVIDYIHSTGLHYSVGACETTIEGNDFDTLMRIATACHHVAVEAGAEGVSSYIKTSYKPLGTTLTIDSKLSKHQKPS